jgi:hypothetical protein
MVPEAPFLITYVSQFDGFKSEINNWEDQRLGRYHLPLSMPHITRGQPSGDAIQDIPPRADRSASHIWPA